MSKLSFPKSLSPHARRSTLAIALAAVANILISCSPAEPAAKAEPMKAKAAEKNHLKLDGLVKNGSAIRTKLGFKVYNVDLYLCAECSDENLIYKDREAKRIKITMLREVTGKKFDATVRKNIETNFSAAEKKKWATEIKSFLDAFVDDILAKGSTVLIDYVPGTGTRISLDGKVKETIPGDDFYHALLRLWIGDVPQKSVKHGLLNRKE